MYKVFFKDRTVFFRDDFPEAFRTENGLFYKYESPENFSEIVSAFFRLERINSLYLFHNDLLFLQTEFKSLFTPIRAAGGLIRNSNNEFIVIRRNGLWDLPKGKTEKGELPQDTAVREVCEECGIDAPFVKGFLLKTFHAYMMDGKAILKETDWFDMQIDGRVKTIPQEAENITEVKWLRAEMASSIESNTYPLIIDVLKEAEIL